MANHKRDDLENNSKAQNGIGAAAIGGLLTALLVGAASSSKKNKLERINAEISDIDRQISAYKSKLFGSITYYDEIEALEQKRRELVAERNDLM